MSGLDLFGAVSTQDDGERSDNDWYETASWMTRSLLHFHRAIRGTTVLECASGRDAITTVLRDEAGCTVFTNDVDRRHPAQTHYDATHVSYWQEFAPPVEWIVTNLPFNIAIDILPHAVQHATIGVATILLKSFDEPTMDEDRKPRGPWLAVHPWTRKICLPRHKFRGTGSPSMASDWFIWERQRNLYLPSCVVDHLAKERTGPERLV